MAELASGAVSSLLSLLRNEALLLSRVGSDVEFIKEEMESMYSFLEHLARTAPPAGGHDEQVRTWMKQVRDLAHDCSNCIDLYIRRGDHEVYRARAGRWRYLWWASWLVQKMVAQHNAAIRLGELKERARDVGKRRLRYGVEIPRKEAVGESGAGTPPPGLSLSLPSSSSQLLPTAAGDDDDDEKEEQNQGATAADGSDRLQRALEPLVLEEYCEEKLGNWVKMQVKAEMASIAIVVPDDPENSGAWVIAQQSLTRAAKHFTCTVWINLPEVHLPWDLPIIPREILSYVLRDCETKQQGTGDDEDRQWQAYRYKEDIRAEIAKTVDEEIKVADKIEELKKKIGEVDRKKVEDTKSLMTQLDKRLGVLLHALRLGQEMPETNVPLSMDEALDEAAWMLRAHMESGKSDDEPPIRLSDEQYRDILGKVFPSSKLPQQQPQAHAIAASLCEDHIKEIMESHKISLGIIWDLLLPKLQIIEGNSSKEQATLQGGRDQVPNSVSAAAAAAAIKETKEKMKEVPREVKATSSASATGISETKEKMDEVMWRIRGQLVINGIVDKIRPHLENKKTLIILQDDEDYVSTEADEDDVSQWEDTRNALNLLGCAPGSAVIVSTKNTQKDKTWPPG